MDEQELRLGCLRIAAELCGNVGGKKLKLFAAELFDFVRSGLETRPEGLSMGADGVAAFSTPDIESIATIEIGEDGIAFRKVKLFINYQPIFRSEA